MLKSKVFNEYGSYWMERIPMSLLGTNNKVVLVDTGYHFIKHNPSGGGGWLRLI